MSANADYAKQYYHANKETVAQRAKEWAQANPEKRRASRRKYAEANKEKYAAWRKEWKSTLKGCLAIKLCHLKKAKRARTLVVDIDLDLLLSLWDKQSGRCAISNYPMAYDKSSLFGVSVDRIDPAGGYTRDNVQLLCQGINFAKNMYSNQEMIEFWNYRTTGEEHEREQATSESIGPGQSAAA